MSASTTSTTNAGSHRTHPLGLSNTGFLLDRLGEDCTDVQFMRELTQNSLEAGATEIVWDVDWVYFAERGVYKLSITDNGHGMTGDEQATYIGKLSSTSREQAYDANYGVGAKIAAATRNHMGLLYRSWKDGVGTGIHLWRDPDSGEYGLLRYPVDSAGNYGAVFFIDDAEKPSLIEGHGTIVTLLGDSLDESTLEPPQNIVPLGRIKWMTKALNLRYFRFPDGVRVRVRESWESENTHDSNILRPVHGMKDFLDKYSDASGSVELTGATAHWWILKDQDLRPYWSTHMASGHVAALYKDELYEMSTVYEAPYRLRDFGITYGFNRVVVYVEPHPGVALKTNTSRTALFLDRTPLSWVEYGQEFQSKMPEELVNYMAGASTKAGEGDYMKSIRERLNALSDLLQVSRYRPTKKTDTSNVSIDTSEGDLGAAAATRGPATKHGTHSTGTTKPTETGNVYVARPRASGKTQAEQHTLLPSIHVEWWTVNNGLRVSPYLEDRAAEFDSTRNMLIINGDFRAFTDLIERWEHLYSDSNNPLKSEIIHKAVEEFYTQALMETVIGILNLKGSKEWTDEDYQRAISKEALTTASMQRSHIDANVKRKLGTALGSLSTKKVA